VCLDQPGIVFHLSDFFAVRDTDVFGADDGQYPGIGADRTAAGRVPGPL
jgi:hypothetical protein